MRINLVDVTTNASRNYTLNYDYDELGNILQIQHIAQNGNWTRNYFYLSDSNKLIGHTSGQTDYTYDAAGNMLSIPHLNEMGWDEDDMLVEADLGGGGTAYYRYDSSGNRVRKVIVNGGVKKERLYVGEWELWQQSTNNTIETERETLSISDDQKSFLQLETLTVNNGNTVATPNTNWRYQYDNHLGSACLELDDSANIISYEEYYPFGASSYRSGKNESEVKLKRYRYCGKERDDETGLYYYGARYYAAWIGRFISIDPLAEKFPQLTPYNYAGNKPVTAKDLEGLQGTKDDEVRQQKPVNETKIDNTRVARPRVRLEDIKPIEVAEANVYKINKETGAAVKIGVSGLDLSKRDQALLGKGGEFIYRNNRLSITSKETVNELNNPSEAGPLTEFTLGKLNEDFKTYEGNFPENYYEGFSKAVFKKSIELNGADSGVDAASDFLDIRTMSEGGAILHAYETYARSGADTGFDKVSHYAVSARLQYNNGGLIADIQQYSKEIFFDEIPSWFGNDVGFDSKDMLANNRGQAFGKALYGKYHPRPAEPRFRRFGE